MSVHAWFPGPWSALKRKLVSGGDSIQTGARLRLKLLLALVLLAVTAPNISAQPIQGSGSTFAAPIIARWGLLYRSVRSDGGDFSSPDWIVDYEPVGSAAGMMRLRQPESDFAASDAPLPSDELTRRGLAQFPIVIGGVAAVVNLPGVRPGTLRLSGPVLADIFLGNIKSWSDPALQQINQGLTLPDMPIAVIHRSDGSGTTFNWTAFLSASSPSWKERVGADTSVKWPVGRGAEGSTGIISQLKATQGAISYVESGQVARAALADALIQNVFGTFVRPTLASIQASAKGVDWNGAGDFNLSLIGSSDPNAYPIGAVTFAQVHTIGRSAARTRRTLGFFKVVLEQGNAEAAALGYVPLPDAVVGQVKAYWLRQYPNIRSF
jgi:phosphate transport system substrate-binding protein